jgi:hypothetical protein
MGREETTAALRRELEGYADGGAGILELLEHLQTGNRRLARRDRLSREQLEELSLYCWTLKSTRPTTLMWDRADGLWGGMRTRVPARKRSSKRRTG